MARIRTIKPEFWTDAALIECSLNARLLFIGTWNFADDEGNLDRSAKQIKARIFPADDIDCEPLIQELFNHGLLIEYSVNEKKYIHIQSFKKHQLVNRPGKPQCPIYDDSVHLHGTFTEHSQPEGKGREGKGRELNPLGDKSPLHEFDEAWKRYPKRSGNNPKADALKAWNARLREKIEPAAMLAGLDRYAAWCKATGKIGTETVMQAARFFGPAKPFEQDWELPKPNGNGKQAGPPWWSSDATIIAKGKELHIEPRPGESIHEFKGRINVELGATS